ncbi:hypothetical protein DUI87_19858 [Hirundo rustica rustica]|uniref:Uncharacterized protein n=1 Tax=Hirundo rustica rustica TaxID=333673 RepID=A0A3M0JV98_HIRRU|nr:hypothetical protein DUI87_19858 [Hirundo rustica rustica]
MRSDLTFYQETWVKDTVKGDSQQFLDIRPLEGCCEHDQTSIKMAAKGNWNITKFFKNVRNFSSDAVTTKSPPKALSDL